MSATLFVVAERLPSRNCSEVILFRSDLAGTGPTRSKSKKEDVASSGQAAVKQTSLSKTSRLVIRVSGGPHSGSAIALSEGSTFGADGLFRIGRAANWADLALTLDNKVSQRHCRLYLDAGSLYLADGADASKPSSNGTYVDGKRLGDTRFTPLPSGARITLGTSQLLVVAT